MTDEMTPHEAAQAMKRMSYPLRDHLIDAGVHAGKILDLRSRLCAKAATLYSIIPLGDDVA